MGGEGRRLIPDWLIAPSKFANTYFRLSDWLIAPSKFANSCFRLPDRLIAPSKSANTYFRHSHHTTPLRNRVNPAFNSQSQSSPHIFSIISQYAHSARSEERRVGKEYDIE